MSGHSKWATTKHKKAVIDAKRGKMFAKLIKNVEVAARTGGGDPTGNPTPYDAIQTAKQNSVPNDNIDRAVKRGSGLESGGADWQTIMYEGYGPNGVALLIECLTDNRNRAATEVRTALTRNGGNLADAGSVAYLFTRKGVVIVPKSGGLTEDGVVAAGLGSGALKEPVGPRGRPIGHDGHVNVHAPAHRAVAGHVGTVPGHRGVRAAVAAADRGGRRRPTRHVHRGVRVRLRRHRRPPRDLPQ